MADAFVTHSGMNSTHEALFHKMSMVSYPIFADQPGLAARGWTSSAWRCSLAIWGQGPPTTSTPPWSG